MKRFFFTPGPSQLYPTVEKHIQDALKKHIPSISHRGKEYQEIQSSAIDGLRTLLRIPSTHRIFFLSSGTEGMERVVQNVVEKHSFHFVNGSFAKRFYETAVELGRSPEKYEVAPGLGFDFATIQVPKQAECLCLTHNETSTGVALPMQDIYSLKKQYKDKLIALDVVSSIPYVDIDYTKIDLVFFSVQKGFGLPAGLGVMIVSPQAFAKAELLHKKGVSIGSYHSFLSLEKSALKYQTPETQNVLDIYLLGQVTGDMLQVGIERIRQKTEEKAMMLYDFFDKHKLYKPFVKTQKFRSKTVIVIDVGESKPLIERLKNQGIVVGSGYGSFKDSHIRIANFPATSKDDVATLLKALNHAK